MTKQPTKQNEDETAVNTVSKEEIRTVIENFVSQFYAYKIPDVPDENCIGYRFILTNDPYELRYTKVINTYSIHVRQVMGGPKNKTLIKWELVFGEQNADALFAEEFNTLTQLRGIIDMMQTVTHIDTRRWMLHDVK